MHTYTCHTNLPRAILTSHTKFEWLRYWHLTHTQQTLTQAAELADDVGQADIGDTFQLTADVGRDGLTTHVPRLYVPRNQRHGGVLRVGGAQPWRDQEKMIKRDKNIKKDKKKQQMYYNVLNKAVTLTRVVLK